MGLGQVGVASQAEGAQQATAGIASLGVVRAGVGEGNGTHSSTLAWKIPWSEEPGRLQSMGSRRLDMTERLHFHFSLLCIGEGNGNSLQCSCPENPRDGVAQSQTRLK